MNIIRIGPQDALPDLEYAYDGAIEHILEEQECPNMITVPLVRALLWHESRFNPLAVSPTGPAGLGQFALATWNDGARRDWIEAGRSTRQRFDIFKSLWRTIEHLDRLVSWFSRSGATREEIVKLSLAAYNQGQGTVMKAQNEANEMVGDRNSWDSVAAVMDRVLTDPRRVEEVRRYVPEILKRRDYYLSASIGGRPPGEVQA